MAGMKAALHLMVILLLALSSVSLGAARGQARVAGEVVLCAGARVTTIRVDQNGTPVDHVMICPDMALSLLAGLTAVPPMLLRPAGKTRWLPAPVPVVAETRAVPVPRARDPPAGGPTTATD